MKIISLFSGCGGLDLGFERAVLQPRQKKYGLHDRTAENNDLSLLHELLE